MHLYTRHIGAALIAGGNDVYLVAALNEAGSESLSKPRGAVHIRAEGVATDENTEGSAGGFA